MACFEPKIVARIFEHRAGRTRVKLGVLVIAAAELAFDALQRAAQTAQFALQRKAVGFHLDRDFVFSYRAVVRAVGAGRCAQISLKALNALIEEH